MQARHEILDGEVQLVDPQLGTLDAARVDEGHLAVEDVDAVIMENDGSLSVACESKKPGESSLVDAKAPKEDRAEERSKPALR